MRALRISKCSLTALVLTSLLAMSAFAQPISTPTDYQTVKHQYWDGAVAPPIQCRNGEPVIDARYARPELMAIGDSIYNGVQSGRINWRLAEWSAPVLVALRMDLIREQQADRKGPREFYVPQYPARPRPEGDNTEFGFNLDAAPRPVELRNADKDIAANLDYLANAYQPPNGRALVDNIAFSGANSIDLVSITPRQFRRAAETHLARDKGRDAFTYANAAFVLNPTRAECLEDKTALQQVILRKPKILLVNIGANNGIWRAGFYGEALDSRNATRTACRSDRALPERCVSAMREFLGARLLADLGKMTSDLSAVSEIEGVYINGLIRPSRVANLLPNSEASLADNPQYAREYRLDLFRARSRISGQEVARTDAFADEVNRNIRALLNDANARLGRPKFHFVDVDAAIAAYDRKACAGRSVASVRPGCKSDAKPLVLDTDRHGLQCTVALDNFPVRLEGDGTNGRWKDGFCAGIEQGGLFSMDNMHPSSAGYAILAEAVRVEMNKHQHIPASVLRRGRECPDRAPYQQCTALLVEPGYLTTDNNLRETEFLAWSGTTQRRHLAVVRRLANFMQVFSG